MADNCFHCGQEIEEERIQFDQKEFCCQGCKTVYEVLNVNNLSEYYNLNHNAGVRPDARGDHQFDFLNTKEIFDKVVDFSDDGITVVTFEVPVIHCTSCIWLLESLETINQSVISSNVNFTKKTVQITFRDEEITLGDVARLMTNLGYKPAISLKSIDKKEKPKADRALVSKLVIAGFCFGNIMLLSFPEYVEVFGEVKEQWLEENKGFFRWAMFFLSLPVFFYSSTDYFQSAWQGLKNKYINLDIPIALGIIVIFFKSTYDIILDISPGYFDTLAALLFLMLTGKWFQQQTVKSLAFDRDYKSFYPVAVARLEKEIETPILLSELKKGDRILVRNEEIIPADAILIKGEAMIDNSFVTGESRLIPKKSGDKIFAGGKQSGHAIELEIISEVNQSYLTQLWNNDAFSKQESELNALTNHISHYFTIIILGITLISAITWWIIDPSLILKVVTSILIIACPCALGLSSPFILGNIMRVFGNKRFYIKNTSTIENLAKITDVVFDKTGTITESDDSNISYEGKVLSSENQVVVRSLLRNSNHPLSRTLHRKLNVNDQLHVDDYKEIIGKGQQGFVEGKLVKVGSRSFVNAEGKSSINQTEVYISIDNVVYGKYVYKNRYRKGLNELINQLSNYKLHILSGDNDSERDFLLSIFPENATLKFNQSPADKLDYIKNMEADGKKVLMLGDGLNDAGALKQSTVGISISDDMNSFSPSCDGILDARNFKLIPDFLSLSKTSMRLIIMAFIISFGYNIIGLAFAVTGYLEPVVAAILMPISSVSVLLFATATTRISDYIHKWNLE
ncbi:heavy metal translocating P-type ATPase [Faecalibacter rhinopitheci]|uniref:Heavy metal translocating P-type ATPase metal-binding domain-containing protein n=1 Tax=Faecalibacter rhinopitheci TaxID=2779678 RepID=A0A8J7KD86_9FLAO|nr:heavy metal translocating P-type ATPase metal-binding domain-containing protein [Faecalibacter rhinopitheci]MBF0597031.1 heavy metal translocating P-type ATPase metal-binding domain-containing protein [Faecalibacter rhinopitheci]